MSFLPIHVHSIWSILDSTLSLDKYAKKAKEYGLTAICLTDHMSLKGVVTFAQKTEKEGLRPIIGCELDILDAINDKIYRLTVLAKNKDGYKNIVKMIAEANSKSIIEKHGQPIVYWDKLVANRMGLIALIGDLHSELTHVIFHDWNMAYKSNDIDVCRSLIVKDEKHCEVIEKYVNLFGDDLFIFADNGDLPILQVLREKNKEIADNCLNGKFFTCNNVHYINEDDSEIHKIVIEAKLEADKVKVEKLEDYLDYRIFFSSKPNCHLPKEGDPKTLELLNLIEKFSIQEKPILPQFQLDNHAIFNADDTLYEMCKQGFITTGLAQELRHDKNLKEIYGERIRRELRIFKEAGIASYFLIVHDLMRYARKCGIPADIRGSATGCMTSFLIGISSVDPLRPDPTLGHASERELPLERFYNQGRNTGGNVSLPDIDIDVPPNFREALIDYAREKYGKECVGHIITHSRFKGKGAIKEVFKLKNISFTIANEVTKLMVDEAKISDELAELQLDDPDYGIIQWNLDNIKDLQPYYENHKDAFDIAVALERIPKNASIHAAGIIIANQPLSNLFPVVYSEKVGDLVVAIEGADVEYIGGVKFDVLGVAALEKVYQIQQMINNKMTEAPYGISI